LPDGKTLLEGTTWYQNRFWPAVYWHFWSDYIIHRIHQRVLVHIKTLSEEQSDAAFPIAQQHMTYLNNITYMNSKRHPSELFFGIATGLVAVFNPTTVFEVEYLFNMPWLRQDPRDDFLSVIGVIVMLVGPGLLVPLDLTFTLHKRRLSGLCSQ
jgi:hypothetical protein